MPEATADLAVGNALQAGRLLQGDCVADGDVLDGAEILGRDLALGAPVAGAVNRIGAQQAADMVGAKRRLQRFDVRHRALP